MASGFCSHRRRLPGVFSAAPDAISEMMAAMTSYRAARNATLADVGKLCAAHAGKLTEAWVRIDLAGAQPAITVLEPDAGAPLKRCLVDNLRKVSYPKRAQGMPPKEVNRVPLKDAPMPGMH